jgi:hypothetical protein
LDGTPTVPDADTVLPRHSGGFLGKECGFRARHRLLEENSWAAIVASFRDRPIPFSSVLVVITK